MYCGCNEDIRDPLGWVNAFYHFDGKTGSSKLAAVNSPSIENKFEGRPSSVSTVQRTFHILSCDTLGIVHDSNIQGGLSQ